VKGESLKRRLFSLRFLVLTSYCLLLTVSSCALPRIIVLDDPLTPEEHINLGLAYEKKGESDLAIEEYKTASKKMPAAYLYLGNIYQQMKKLDEAEAFYRKAIEKAPTLADAYNNLAWLYFTENTNLDEAERLASRAVELNPSKENYQDTLSNIKQAIGNRP
jgi:tetratricopeptide (TPR) repeat protein